MSGHFLFYKYVNYCHKVEFKNYIKSNISQIEEIEITPSQLFVDSEGFIWKDDNTELKIGNEMYDIVSISYGTKIILRVVNDKIEKKLFENYKMCINSNSEDNKLNILKDFLSLKVIFNSEGNDLCLFPQSIVFFPEPFIPTCLGYITIQIPPPLT